MYISVNFFLETWPLFGFTFVKSRLRFPSANDWDPRSKTWKREAKRKTGNAEINHPTHRFIKLLSALFMDSSCAQNIFASPVIRTVSLNWEAHPCASCSLLARPVHPCFACVNKTTRHLKQNGALPQRLFPQPASFASSSLNYLLQCLQCWLVLRSNRLQCFAPTHEPQNHQNREGNVVRNPFRIRLCCGPPSANLLSAVDTVAAAVETVAAVVGFCIHR